MYVTNSNNSTMYTSVRSAAELIAQEIGQAGAVCGTATSTSVNTIANCSGLKLKSSVVSGATAMSLQDSNGNSTVAGLFQGEKLTIVADNTYGNSNQEVVQISTIDTIGKSVTLAKAASNPHFQNAMVVPQGVFPYGVLATSTSTTLKLFGDINGDGVLRYVEYDCTGISATGTTTLTRTSTPINVTVDGVTDTSATAITLLTRDVLVDNVVWKAPAGYTGAPYCFTPKVVQVIAPDGVTTYNTVTNVQLLISVQAPNLDPETRQYAQMTKSFLQLAPRNVVAANTAVGLGNIDSLQPTPLSIPGCGTPNTCQ
jgi:hypothetical protein